MNKLTCSDVFWIIFIPAVAVRKEGCAMVALLLILQLSLLWLPSALIALYIVLHRGQNT